MLQFTSRLNRTSVNRVVSALTRQCSKSSQCTPQCSASPAAIPKTEGSQPVMKFVDEFVTSNEVKLIRLLSTKIYNQVMVLFKKHVAENPSIRSLVMDFKSKMGGIQGPGAQGKSIGKK